MKTYYLSEDNDNSPFVRLFNAVYGRANVLIGVGRNAKLFNKARYLSADGSRVVIYLDIVPDNARLYDVYDRLRKLNIELNRDVHIIPIACAEFAFICSVQNLIGPVWSSEGSSPARGTWVEICVDGEFRGGGGVVSRTGDVG